MNNQYVLLVCVPAMLLAVHARSEEVSDGTTSAPTPPEASPPAANAPTETTQNEPRAVQDNDSTDAQEKPADETIVLEPISITDNTQLSFHFSLRITRTKPGNHIVSMYVDRVLAGSNAEEMGLRAGMKIIAIDGKRVEEYDGTFLNGSELNKIFIGRHDGAQVRLLVSEPDGTGRQKIEVTRRTLTWISSY